LRPLNREPDPGEVVRSRHALWAETR
jgi:hypothetical protein